MNTVKKCSISGIAFTLEADAYEALENYLETLRKQYAGEKDGEEIVADIEARIAELLLSTQDGSRIVELPLIQNIIAQMGSAEQIDRESHDDEPQGGKTARPEQPRIPRRLYRNPEGARLGGVCSGIQSGQPAERRCGAGGKRPRRARFPGRSGQRLDATLRTRRAECPRTGRADSLQNGPADKISFIDKKFKRRIRLFSWQKGRFVFCRS